MNDISRAMEKKRAEKAKHRYAVGAESGADWGLTLIYQALHDKYGFGRNRFAKLNEAWEHLDSKEHGFSIRWRDELCDHFGFDRFLNERDAQRLERLITGRTKDWRLRKYVTDHVAASVIVTLHSLRHDFKWGAKRLQDLQQYIHDNIDAVLKSQVPIWEFMKCLHVECGIDYPALTAYEKQFGPVDIYRGNRGER
ncbi:hypothetical protein SAMN02910401_00475 [Megasphaera elsdenii]|uniref:hypothetical protein n=1 Tax=Megasphaera elsdenii TaxID=907 RepID=UPI0008E9F29F|nr:hypothetical protein [Megasphaera elsdenii]SFH82706.1 hypothetical protein SAMN02910401_00475 [Megasphaera elsdenii]